MKFSVSFEGLSNFNIILFFLYFIVLFHYELNKHSLKYIN